MGKIYTGANEKIAWLGQEDPIVSEHAFNFIRRLAEVRDVCFRQLEEKNVASKHATRKSVLEKEVDFEAAEETQRTIERTELEAFAHLARHPWWRRCWILQEASLSPYTILLTETDSLPLVAMDPAHFVLRQVRHLLTLRRPEEEVDRVHHSETVQMLSRALKKLHLVSIRYRRQFGALNLQEALRASRTCYASDLRDHVYAILGLVQSPHRLKPSYESTNSVAEVFIDATKAVIEEDSRLDVLELAGAKQSSRALHLPSWVPNFSEESRYSMFERRRFTVPACGKQMSCEVIVPKPSFANIHPLDERNVLTCWGISLGCVAAKEGLGLVGDGRDRHFPSLVDIQADWRSRMYAVHSSQIYIPTGEPLEAAFQSTLRHGYRVAFQESQEQREDVQLRARKEIRESYYADKYFRDHVNSGVWRFFANQSGYIGIVPAETQHDDTLTILFEAELPYILRKIDKGKDFYVVVGPAYIHGIRPKNEIKAVYLNKSAWQNTLKEISIYRV